MTQLLIQQEKAELKSAFELQIRAELVSVRLRHLGYDERHNFLGNKAMVDALLSRVRHYCHTVTINGPSLRELQG
jgi:DNA replication protein DnaC